MTETRVITTESTKAEIDIIDQLGAILATDAEPSFARYLWYGDLGEGKTYLTGLLHNALVAQGTRGCFGMDFDGAMRNVLKSAGVAMPVKTYLGATAYDSFENDIMLFAEKSHGFGALIIDPLTAFERIIMKKVMRINPISRNLKDKLGTLPYGAPALQDYGVQFEVLNNIFQLFQSISLHMNLVLTAHIIERSNPVTNITEFLPSMPGKRMPSSIGRWFNEVWRIHTESVKGSPVRFAQTASMNKYKCKSQVYGMPDDLPVDEAISRTLRAYQTGSGGVAPTPAGDVRSQKTHPGDMDLQTDVEAEVKTLVEVAKEVSEQEVLRQLQSKRELGVGGLK